METYNYEDPIVNLGLSPDDDITQMFAQDTNTTPAFTPGTNTAPAFTPGTSTTPAFTPSTNTTPAFTPSTNTTPAFTPGTNTTPAFTPGTNTTPAFTPGTSTTPAFTPGTNTTPAFPTYPSSCVNCTGNGVVRPGNGNILWTWGTLSPFFSTSSSISHVRFYNAAAIQEPLDLYLNGRLVVSNLEYMNITSSLHILPGVYRFTVYRRTNPGGYPIIDTRVQFRGGNSYTLTILGTVNNFSVQLISS